jgi:phosphoglycerate dehydrogenase-like enzyme
MPKVIYVTEPDVIDIQEVTRLLPDDYHIVPGNTEFSGELPQDCTALIIRSETHITPSIKDFFPNLTDILRIGTGVDAIDLDYCNREHIAVYNAPGANADAVSDYVVCMMLVALRKVHTLTQQDVDTWNRFKFTGHSMSGQSVGIIGFGNIGRQIHKKLQGFGCNLFAYDPFVKPGDFPEGVVCMPSVDAVLEKSTIVTMHLPLLPTTKYIINKDNLALLRDKAILINSSRGGIVNEADIADAVRTRGLTYIADTVEGEPAVNPVLNENNIIVTPHIASLTEESEANMIQFAVSNYLQHKPMNQPQ